MYRREWSRGYTGRVENMFPCSWRVSPNTERPATVYRALDPDCGRDLAVWEYLHRGITYWSGMFSLGHKQMGLIIDYCLGLCSPSETEEAEELIAHSDRAADVQSQVQTALAFLSYVPVERCPDCLADLTVRRLRRLAAQRTSTEGTKTKIIGVNPHQWFRRTAAITAVAASILVFTGILIRSFSPTSLYDPRQAPTGQLEKISVNMDLGDSQYVWLPVLDELQIIGPVPQILGSYPGASGSPGYYPRRLDHFIGPGPRVLPASWDCHLVQPSQDHLTPSSPSSLSGQSR